MYKKRHTYQQSIFDFGQAFGLVLNPENRWVKLAKLILWSEFEDK